MEKTEYEDGLEFVGQTINGVSPTFFKNQETGCISPIIKVIGVGGGGSNAVNQMVDSGIKGVDFVVCNTDSQALSNSNAKIKIQLGVKLTEGLGAGNDPEVGQNAAIEALPAINEVLGDHTKMIFITAGMGGGTGTGAAPIIAKAAKDKGILTVGIVTIPFSIEGPKRLKQANEGIVRMRSSVDALLVINDDKLSEYCKDQTQSEAFKKANDVVATATKGIAEIITLHGRINVDFRDVNSVMKDGGVALLGSGEAEGEGRDMKAVKDALTSPLLNDNDIKGAQNILLNITSSEGESGLKMFEFDTITKYVQKIAGQNTNIIWGTKFDDSMEKKIRVTIIATGFHYDEQITTEPNFLTLTMGEKLPKKVLESEDLDCITLDDDFSYVKNLDDLNKEDYLTSLENEPAINRKKRNSKDEN